MKERLLPQVKGNVPDAFGIDPGPKKHTAQRRKALLSVQEVVCWVLLRPWYDAEVSDLPLAGETLLGKPQQNASYRVSAVDGIPQGKNVCALPYEWALELGEFDITVLDPTD